MWRERQEFSSFDDVSAEKLQKLNFIGSVFFTNPLLTRTPCSQCFDPCGVDIFNSCFSSGFIRTRKPRDMSILTFTEEIDTKV